jgi:hypothetical protein
VPLLLPADRGQTVTMPARSVPLARPITSERSLGPWAGTLGRQRASYPRRAIHLLDVENLIGTGAPDPAQVRLLRSSYHAQVGIRPLDQVIIGCCHVAFKTVAFCWTGPRYRVRSGPDGADQELLDVIQHEQLAARFTEVIIGSGDGLFAWAAAELAVAGSQVTVVSRRGHLARALEMAAGRRVIYLDVPRDQGRLDCWRPGDAA